MAKLKKYRGRKKSEVYITIQFFFIKHNMKIRNQDRLYLTVSDFKSRVHCFSMQVVMNKCFLLNPEKSLAQIRLVVFEKNAPLIPKKRHRTEG